MLGPIPAFDKPNFLNLFLYILLRSIELKPNEGVSKYMNLGQITSGPEAVDAFRKGIELLKKELGSRAKKGVRAVYLSPKNFMASCL